MSERHHLHLRDRTLVLRILVPSLEMALRDKMTSAEETVSSRSFQAQNTSTLTNGVTSSAPPPNNQTKGHILDLEGVTVEPAILGLVDVDPTLWTFHCDGAVYPARLVNLPCPVELLKTIDHATYFKSVDVSQMLIVYEDMQALEEAESMGGYKVDGYPSYFHSGLTSPMTRVVERRFAAREHKAIPPPKSEVSSVEKELVNLVELLNKETLKKGKGSSSTSDSPVHRKSSFHQNVKTEIEDEIVDYEPWMDNHGKTPQGIEFDERDDICKKHPEVWLSAQQYAKILESMAPPPPPPLPTAESQSFTNPEKKAKGTVISTESVAKGSLTGTSNVTMTSSGNELPVETEKKKIKKKKKTTETATIAPAVPKINVTERPGNEDYITEAAKAMLGGSEQNEDMLFDLFDLDNDELAELL